MAEQLVERTAQAGALDAQAGDKKRSALHWACDKGMAGTVSMLLSLGANCALADAVSVCLLACWCAEAGWAEGAGLLCMLPDHRNGNSKGRGKRLGSGVGG